LSTWPSESPLGLRPAFDLDKTNVEDAASQLNDVSASQTTALTKESVALRVPQPEK